MFKNLIAILITFYFPRLDGLKNSVKLDSYRKNQQAQNETLLKKEEQIKDLRSQLESAQDQVSAKGSEINQLNRKLQDHDLMQKKLRMEIAELKESVTETENDKRRELYSKNQFEDQMKFAYSELREKETSIKVLVALLCTPPSLPPPPPLPPANFVKTQSFKNRV